MKNKKLHFLSSEIFVSTPEHKVHIHRGVQGGEYRKLTSKIYTTNLRDSLKEIVLRNLWAIVSYFFPEGLIVDRTAFEFKPSQEGMIYLISKRTRTLKLPGPITIKPRKGQGPLPSDRSFMGNLKVCSPERAYLENLDPSRTRQGAGKRTLSKIEIEEKLESILKNDPENGLRQLRKNAALIAPQLNREREYETLDLLIGGLLRTKEVNFSSSLAKARSSGYPYDPKRAELLQNLMTHLLTLSPLSRISKNRELPAWKNVSFFEAYFSNFIEGTEFEINEAAEIIFEGKIPKNRPDDAHDVIGTYQLVSSKEEMAILPKTSEDLLEILKRRHQVIMSSRPHMLPGKFKEKANRAGATFFVQPELVLGTLKIGFEIYKTLEVPFHRAVFMQFFISEIHPFTDWNGRLSRVMMNAELIAHGEERIIIPNVYRGNYLSALSALSNHGIPDPLIRALDFAQKYVTLMTWEDFNQALELLKHTNAFMDSSKAEIEGIRLKLPEYL